MKNLFYLFFLFNVHSYYQDNALYVMIDDDNKSLYKLTKEVKESNNEIYYITSIKILKDKYRKFGFNNNNNNNNNGKTKPANDEIVIVEDQPSENNYYEFISYSKPEQIKHIDDSLKIYSIKDISKKEEAIKEVWRNFSLSIFFIEKKTNNYNVFRMRPLYHE